MLYFVEFCYKESNSQWSSIDIDNGLEYRLQAILCTNDGLN